MIESLYEKFKHWSAKGSVYIISDTHFEDPDCKLMDSNWISPEEHIQKIKEKVHKNDTLICLGDCGNAEWFNQLKCYKVLVKGNHDSGSANYISIFDEIYEGPLFISEKILLSHEPIEGDCWYNFHGHRHSDNINNYKTKNSQNVASNVINYDVINLGQEIKKGILSNVSSCHRVVIDKATLNKHGQERINHL